MMDAKHAWRRRVDLPPMLGPVRRTQVGCGALDARVPNTMSFGMNSVDVKPTRVGWRTSRSSKYGSSLSKNSGLTTVTSTAAHGSWETQASGRAHTNTSYLHMMSLEDDQRAKDIKQSKYDIAALTAANSL
jgi:hypothetical protein